MRYTPEELENLRKLAHEAPMNTVHTSHKGNRSLGSHSMAWAQASRDYFKALEENEKGI